MARMQPATDESRSMVGMWRQMLRIRRFDEAATRLLRSGQMPGVLHLTTGQEAVVSGSSAAMRPDDLLIGTHRNHGYPIARGGDLGPLMAEVLGKATGVCQGRGGEMHLIDPSVGAFFSSAILGSGLPVAVGTALSSQLQRNGRVTLATFGDGASNEGAVHESMNLAAIWKLPIVFLCENNGYAVTVAASYAVSVRDIADRAAAYGMPGRVADGSDPVAVREAVQAARDRAGAGHGPSLVEAKTYRTVDHAENLPSQPYRPEEEVEGWRKRDPIISFRGRLLQEGHATAGELDKIEQGVTEEVAAAVKFASDSPFPEPTALWEHMYADPALNGPPGPLSSPVSSPPRSR
jgi:acetoin:2,6-dichlorophenolindophenol oxidoreductase subunit alpha